MQRIRRVYFVTCYYLAIVSLRREFERTEVQRTEVQHNSIICSRRSNGPPRLHTTAHNFSKWSSKNHDWKNTHKET